MIYEDNCFPIQTSITKNQVYSITSNQAGGEGQSHSQAFPHPGFGLFAVCKNAGGRPRSIHHVSDVNICLGRQSGRGEKENV